MAFDKKVNHDFLPLVTDASSAAQRLLGCVLEREIDGELVRVRIVETEAYDESDAASHSHTGMTPRTEIMFGSAGYAYVYFTYGMHYCCNVVVGEDGYGAAVLIRAVEPIVGIDILERYRKGKTGVELTNGPAKMCQALAIDKRLNGHDMSRSPFKLIMQPKLPHPDIVTTTRIGINRAKDVLWRFYVADNPYVSVRARSMK
jgi:DNA-3-methyladenine glycosylase